MGYSENDRDVVFYFVLIGLLVFAGLFLYTVFVKTDACVLDPLDYWAGHFEKKNGEFNCFCSTLDPDKEGFHFSSVDTKVRSGIYNFG